MQPKLTITTENCLSRIENAITTILDCWDEWEAYAGQEAQQSQHHEAYDEALAAQLESVLLGMLFDDCPGCGGTGVCDSGGFTPDGKSIDVPCICQEETK